LITHQLAEATWWLWQVFLRKVLSSQNILGFILLKINVNYQVIESSAAAQQMFAGEMM
jgi:hypothetical protein